MPLFPGQFGGRDEFTQPNKPSGPAPKNPYRMDEVTDAAAKEVGFESADTLRDAVAAKVELTSDQVRYATQTLVNLSEWLKNPSNPTAVAVAKDDAKNIVEKWGIKEGA